MRSWARMAPSSGRVSGPRIWGASASWKLAAMPTTRGSSARSARAASLETGLARGRAVALEHERQQHADPLRLAVRRGRPLGGGDARRRRALPRVRVDEEGGRLDGQGLRGRARVRQGLQLLATPRVGPAEHVDGGLGAAPAPLGGAPRGIAAAALHHVGADRGWGLAALRHGARGHSAAAPSCVDAEIGGISHRDRPALRWRTWRPAFEELATARPATRADRGRRTPPPKGCTAGAARAPRPAGWRTARAARPPPRRGRARGRGS